MSSASRRSALALFLVSMVAVAGCSAATVPVAPTASGSPAASTPEATEGPLEVGIAQIVDHPSLNNLRDGFKQGMTEAGYVEGTDVVYEDRNASGDQATLTSIASGFRDKALVVAIATPTAQAVAQAIPDKPIFFAGVTDPVGAGLVESLEAPGSNLTGTSDFPPIADQLALVKELVPYASTIGLLYSSAETNSHIHAQLVKDAAPGLGLTVQEATVANSSEVAQAAESLKDVDAFFVGNDNTIVSAIESVVQVSEANQVPLIVSDPDSVERGALAAYAVDYLAQGQQTGRMAASMLKFGRTPAEIPVETAANLELSLNTGAAQRMGVTVPPAVLDRVDHTTE
ncbi:MAG: ABC transporter substrate-binding protein [Propionibacteriaceae bacterium]|nr:ABC transporter substrate-binding protein [Propionibacteriaceae bacterium]